MRLSSFEKTIFASVIGTLAGAKADECLADGLGMAHRIQDAAMNHIVQWRIRVKAERMRRRARAKRRALAMSNERWHADGGTVRDENGLAVAHVVGQDEDNSDAVLIAAAPELLTVLRSLVATVDAYTTADGRALQETALMRRARAIVAEAEGRQP